MSRRIEVREEKKERTWIVRIDPFFNPSSSRAFSPQVTVFSDKDYSHEDHEFHWRRAYISWTSLGGVSYEEATAFTLAIASAVDHAKKMDREHGFTTDTTKTETKKC